MPEKKIVLPAPGLGAKHDLLKSHVAAYTRKDGTFVAEHDDKRAAAQPHPGFEKGAKVTVGGKSGTVSGGFAVPGADDGRDAKGNHGYRVEYDGGGFGLHGHGDIKGEAEPKKPAGSSIGADKKASKAAPKKAQKQGAEASNAIAKKHSDKLVRKADSWSQVEKAGKIPAADVAKFPEYSHKEVYGHDGETSPVADDFHPDFVKKHDPAKHPGFIIKHKDGKRNFVDTQGSTYARYHARIDESEAPAAGGAEKKAAAPAYDHPNVVGTISNHKAVVAGGKVGAGNGDPTHSSSVSFGFAGKTYMPTGKTGKSLHDGTPVHEHESEDGHRVWADAKGRVHADSHGEVDELRAAHEKSQAGKAKNPAKAAEPESALGKHKVGDTVQYVNDRGVTRQGVVKGERDGKVAVHHKAGYQELIHHSKLTKVEK